MPYADNGPIRGILAALWDEPIGNRPTCCDVYRETRDQRLPEQQSALHMLSGMVRGETHQDTKDDHEPPYPDIERDLQHHPLVQGQEGKLDTPQRKPQAGTGEDHDLLHAEKVVVHGRIHRRPTSGGILHAEEELGVDGVGARDQHEQHVAHRQPQVIPVEPDRLSHQDGGAYTGDKGRDGHHGDGRAQKRLPRDVRHGGR